MFLSIVIYIVVGCRVFRQRNRLRSAGLQSLDKNGRLPSMQTTDVDDSAEEVSCKKNLGLTCSDCGKICPNRVEYYGTAVTEVHIESDISPCDDHGHLIRQPPAHVATISKSDRNTAEATQPFHTMQLSTRTSVSATPRSNKTSISQQLGKLKRTATTRLKRLDPVKMAYLRTSFVFGFAVLITWIPSSVNRLYSIANHGHINFQLSAVSGTVLPLQGVWNSLIFFTTSWRTVSHICNGTAETIFRRRSTRLVNEHPSRRRFGASLRMRTPNVGRDRRRESLRSDELELQARLSGSTQPNNI